MTRPFLRCALRCARDGLPGLPAPQGRGPCARDPLPDFAGVGPGSVPRRQGYGKAPAMPYLILTRADDLESPGGEEADRLRVGLLLDQLHARRQGLGRVVVEDRHGALQR